MIRVGPCGWAYKDWWGIVYPAKKPKGFDELRYLAQYFDTIEVNVTFYRPIPENTAKGWVERVEENRDFRFTAKLLDRFTHHQDASAEDEKQVKEGFAALLEAGRLGAVLMQFPWSFRNTPEHRQYISKLKSKFSEYPLVLEVRHASWAEPGVLDFLEQLEIGLCNIDQPLFRRSIEPGAEATSGIGYIRLHGRNYQTWFSERASVRERYDYLYTVDELEPWVDRARIVAQRTADTYVMSNNHNIGKAAANALEVKGLLTGERVPAPTTLVEHYPELLNFVE